MWRIIWDIWGSVIATTLTYFITSFIGNALQIDAIAIILLNIYLAIVHILMSDSAYKRIFGYKAEVENILQKYEILLGFPFFDIFEIKDLKDRNAIESRKKISDLGNLRWLAYKFLSSKARRNYINENSVEIGLTKREYSEFLNLAIVDCKSSIDWIGIVPPKEMEDKGLVRHSRALYIVCQNEVNVMRVFILTKNEYNEIFGNYKDFYRKFIEENDYRLIDLRFAIDEDLKRNYGDTFEVEDFGLYDNRIAIVWNAGPQKEKAKMVVGSELEKYRMRIRIVRDDSTYKTFRKLCYNEEKDAIEEVRGG